MINLGAVEKDVKKVVATVEKEDIDLKAQVLEVLNLVVTGLKASYDLQNQIDEMGHSIDKTNAVVNDHKKFMERLGKQVQLRNTCTHKNVKWNCEDYGDDDWVECEDCGEVWSTLYSFSKMIKERDNVV